MADLTSYIEANGQRLLDELFDFLRIPSVSARGEHTADVREAAEWVAAGLRDIGFQAELHETPGHPIVLGEWRGAGPDAPTVLIYGHYDVQPPEPLSLWTSPPFEPTIRDDRLYARGAVDDKGQLHLHLKALETLASESGRLPLNVLVLAEGEEEVGSPNLMPFVQREAAGLAADAVVISDTAMIAPGVPTIGASLRGLAFFEVEVVGPARDLHSGSYGGAVVNPATVLTRIIGSMHDQAWKVTIPGFYDDVDAAETFRERLDSIPFDEASFLEETGAPAVDGEAGFGTLERLWIRPTLEVNGLLSGYTGEGPKTVLPARAMAKISCRLVPRQDPEAVRQLIEDYVRHSVPRGVTATVRTLQAGSPWRSELRGPLYDAAKRALEQAFGRPPVAAGEGGSIPIVAEFERLLSAPVLLMGFGLPGENAHAPDEWLSLDNYWRGMHAATILLRELAGSSLSTS